MKIRFLLMLFACSALVNVRTVNAQVSGDTAMYWRKIRETESRISAIEVQWESSNTLPPRPQFNVPRSVEYASAQMAMRGTKSTDQFRQNIELSSEGIRTGHTTHSAITICSNGTVTRGDILADVYGDPSKKAHCIDVFDGQNIIYALGFGSAIPIRGQLHRDLKERFNFFASGHARPILYFAAPITSEFPQETTVIRETANNTITLEHLLPYKTPLLGRLVLSKEHWRPVEMTIENPYDHKIIWKYLIDGYRTYESGIYFPSHISEALTDARGTILTTSELTLSSVKFNIGVDKSIFDQPVPLGTHIADFRFGSPGISYRLNGPIPSDKAVQAFIKARKDAEEKSVRASRSQSLLKCAAYGLFGGACLYCIKRLRNRHTKKANSSAQ